MVVLKRRVGPEAAVGEQGDPWVDSPTPPCRALPEEGGVLAVVPTAGRDAGMLRGCLDSLQRAAEGVALRVVVVVCPASAEATARVRELCRGLAGAEAVALDGAFGYPRSVNAGIATLRPGEGYVLLLNDDCRFRGAGDLARLRDTLRVNAWACVGPVVEGVGCGVSGVGGEGERARAGGGPVELREPVIGCCALWRTWWLERVGPFDERFGLGYGHDESDQTLRARYLGARWGREEGVTVEHAGGATFGAAATDPGGEFYGANVRRWREKWGEGVHPWGGSVHWQALPGVQVVISAWNCEAWLGRCLESVEEALAGFRWALCVADDGSTDGTLGVALAHRSAADVVRVARFPKGATVGQAKNRALGLLGPLAESFTAVAFVDADDTVTPERVRHLLGAAVDGGHPCVHGAFRYEGVGCRASGVGGNGPAEGQVVGPNERQQEQGWLSPCTTVFHRSLVPADGRLFCEDLEAMEDAECFLRWWMRGVRSVPVPGAVVYEYRVREGSVMSLARRPEVREAWEARRAALRARV